MQILYIVHLLETIHPLADDAAAGVDRSVAERIVDRILIVHDAVGDGVKVYIFSIPVAFVLGHDQLGVVGPGIEFERTVVNQVCRVGTEGVAVLLNDVLTLWHHDTGIGQGQEVWGRLLQGEDQGLLVGSFNAQFGNIHLTSQNSLAVLQAGQQVGVWRTNFWGHNSSDSVSVILSGYRLAVAPGVVTQMEGPDIAGLVGFPGLSAGAFTDVLAIFLCQSGQRLHNVGQDGGAVGVVADYAVQSGWLSRQVTVKVLFLVQHVAVDGLLLCCGILAAAGGSFLAAASCQRKHHRACQQNRQDSFDFHDNFSFRAYQTLLFYTASSLKPCN